MPELLGRLVQHRAPMWKASVNAVLIHCGRSRDYSVGFFQSKREISRLDLGAGGFWGVGASSLPRVSSSLAMLRSASADVGRLSGSQEIMSSKVPSIVSSMTGAC